MVILRSYSFLDTADSVPCTDLCADSTTAVQLKVHNRIWYNRMVNLTGAVYV